MRDPFAVACKAKGRLGWPETKALLLVIAQCPDGLDAWAYAAQVADVLGVDEQTQEAVHAEAATHRAQLEGDTPRNS